MVEALSGSKNKLICKVSQLVKLIKDGKPFKMSKRKGDYITVEDLIAEVGRDATRFIMLNRSSDVELDFDFTKVKENQKKTRFITFNIVMHGYHLFSDMLTLISMMI